MTATWFWFTLFILTCIYSGIESLKLRDAGRKLEGQRRRIVELEDAVGYWQETTLRAERKLVDRAAQVPQRTGAHPIVMYRN